MLGRTESPTSKLTNKQSSLISDASIMDDWKLENDTTNREERKQGEIPRDFKLDNLKSPPQQDADKNKFKNNENRLGKDFFDPSLKSSKYESQTKNTLKKSHKEEQKSESKELRELEDQILKEEGLQKVSFPEAQVEELLKNTQEKFDPDSDQPPQVSIGDLVRISIQQKGSKKPIQWINFDQKESKWCCTKEDKEISDFIIRPVLHKSPEIIVKLYKGTIKDDKNKKSNISEQYVSSVRNVPKNLKYLEETKKHPLHLTQPFMLKVVATSSQKAKFELNTSKKSKNNDPEKDNSKKIEDSWILLSVDPNDKEVYVKPMTCYYLTKIVNSKIRYLKRKSPHKLTADKEKAAKIEICIKRKDLHDTPDLANDPVVAIKYDSYAKIPLQNYFTVKFSKSSGKSLISFETKLKFSEEKQYLGWTENKDKLERKVILVNEEYPFELEEVDKGEGGEHLLTNQQFLLKIPDTNYCLRSVSSSYKRMSDVKISEFDKKDAEEFYFHIQRMQ